MASPEFLTPDLCVIGGGPAGSAMALAATGLGLSCVLIESRLPLGRGPAGDLARDMLIAAPAGEPFEALRTRIAQAVAIVAPAHSIERLRAVGVRVVQGTGRLTGPRTVTAGAVTIRPRRIVIATGARPLVPKLEGQDLIRVLTPETLFEMTALPSRIAIIGEAPAAFELAQALRRLGSAVTLITAGPPIDPELWSAVEAALVRDGIDLRLGGVAERLQPHGTGATISISGHTPGVIDATHVLVANGTRPFTESLGLDAAGVRVADHGPAVGHDLRTSNRRIFAIGDVLGASSRGGAAIPLHVAAVLRAAFFRQVVRHTAHQVPRVMRTVPSVAEVGLSEAGARQHHREIVIVRAPFADNERAIANRSTEGHIKVVATRGGRVLGAAIVGAGAAELIAPWGLAITHSIPLGAMAAVATAQPSLSDASRRVALAYVAGRLRRPWVKRVLGVLKLLG